MVKIQISKPVCLVDEEVVVKVTELGSRDRITLLVTTDQGKVKFWSYGVFQANESGVVDCTTDKPLRGSYDGVEPMGLFWSLTAAPWELEGQRLYTINSDIYRKYTFAVFPDNNDPVIYLNNEYESIASLEHYRGYKSKTVRRIPVKHDRLYGTVLIPEGPGPFPAVIDMYGGFVHLFESRAALLASHGFVTYALAYVNGENLPNTVEDMETFYFQEAVDWFVSQEYVQKGGIGVVGLCLGGTMAMWMTENIPIIRAVVNLNGMPFPFDTWTHKGEYFYTNGARVEENRVWLTNEGFVVKDIFVLKDSTPLFQSWRNGAKTLVCFSGDDFMTRAEYQMKWYENIPEEFKSSVQFQYYPGAGHLLEPPYMPVLRVVDVRKQLREKSAIKDKLLMSGGYQKTHAVAQRDCWTRMLAFLKDNLKHDNHVPNAKL